MKMQKSVIFVKENLKINIWKIKNLAKLEIIAIIQESTCLGKNTGKYITFTVPIKKEVTRIDENGEEITKNISYLLQFIDSRRFMASSLSNLVNNLFEGLHRIKCKLERDDKKMWNMWN